MAGLLREALGRGLLAFRANRLPMAVVLVLGGTLLATYALVPPVRTALDAFAAWKDGLGLWYPVLAFPLIGGLLPTLVTALVRRQRPTPRTWAVVAGFWPERGLEIHFLYLGLGLAVGTGTDVGTILIKTALDMFVYSTFWALPVYLLVLGWAQGERPLALIRDPQFWRERYLPGLMANWLLWIPAVLMIYSLPPGLQLPVQNLFMFIWVLIASLIGSRKAS